MTLVTNLVKSKYLQIRLVATLAKYGAVGIYAEGTFLNVC
jgi:hypothetical protein